MDTESTVVQFLAAFGALVLALVAVACGQSALNGIISIWRQRRDASMLRYLHILREEAQEHQNLDEKQAVIALLDEIISQAESTWGNEDIIDRFAILSKRQRREEEIERQHAKGTT